MYDIPKSIWRLGRAAVYRWMHRMGLRGARSRCMVTMFMHELWRVVPLS